MSCHWTYFDADGQPASQTSSTEFPNQGDAETFIGQQWQELLASGVESVVLHEGDRTVYGPMSLRPEN